MSQPPTAALTGDDEGEESVEEAEEEHVEEEPRTSPSDAGTTAASSTGLSSAATQGPKGRRSTKQPEVGSVARSRFEAPSPAITTPESSWEASLPISGHPVAANLPNSGLVGYIGRIRTTKNSYAPRLARISRFHDLHSPIVVALQDRLMKESRVALCKFHIDLQKGSIICALAWSPFFRATRVCGSGAAPRATC